MAKCPEEFNFPYVKRRKLINKLSEAGFTVTEKGNVYVSNPENGHPQIEGHYLPVAFMRSFFVKLVNLDERFFEGYHIRIREIHSTVLY